jgi:hypothetical protein
MLPRLGAAGDEAKIVHVSAEDCTRLVKHLPADDVTYQPGVDVHGQPVTPADIGAGSEIKLPDIIQIPITVDLQDRFGIPANSILFKAEAEIGVAEFRFSDERVTFNGVELTNEEERALAAACAEPSPVP